LKPPPAHPQKLFTKVEDTAKAPSRWEGEKQLVIIIFYSFIKYDRNKKMKNQI